MAYVPDAELFYDPLCEPRILFRAFGTAYPHGSSQMRVWEGTVGFPGYASK